MFLLFHLLLVAVSLAPSAGEPTAGDTYNASMCPTSLSCGDHVDIRYPFYLSNEPEVMDGIAYSYCGYPGMAIACVRGHPVLHLNNDSYTVLNIDYGNNTVSLVDTDALDGGSCPRVRHNVTIPPPLGPLVKFPVAATDYLSFFFNCTFTPDIPKPSDVEPINCRGFDGGTGLSYVFAQPNVPAGGWPRACKEAYDVPVLGDSLWSSQNYSQFLEGGYGALLKQGFQLTWDPSTGPCLDCEQSKGQCSYNQSGGFLGCMCSDGSVRNPHCVPPSKAQSNVYFRYSDCTPTPYQCGSVKFDIDYPFSVNGVNRPDYCSYPGYRLFCTNGTLVFYMNSARFQVTNVDHDNHLLTVIDRILAQETCLQSYRKTTINDAMFMYTDRDQFLTVYVNCSAKSSSFPLVYDLFSCFSGGSSCYRLDNTLAPDVLGVRSSTLAVPDNSMMANSLATGNSSLEDAIKGGFTGEVEGGCGVVWCGVETKYSGGHCGHIVSSPTCYCPDGLAIGSCSSGLKNLRKNLKKNGILIGIVSSFSGAILLSLLLLCVQCRKKFHGVWSWKGGSKRKPSIESFLQKHEAQHPKRYTYSEVKRMTKSFTQKLGQGGFGTVYKGNLPNGQQIAVKLLKSCKGDGQEFMNEVASISRTSHVNVVTLLGYCLQESKRALIYEYMPNGSLERFTVGRNSEGENSLSWEKLFDIAVGVARGLEYLHRGCNTRIVHFDIKPHNVLLDQDFCPKISDFGLAKSCAQKESIISIDGARGTIGYIAPEVFSKQFGTASSKSDVYSYGMMILEMVGARKNINVSADASSKYFPQWIYEHLEEYCVNACDISVDTGELVRRMIIVGLWCIQLLPNNRPSMTRVVEMLESCANDLQIPPQNLLS